MDVLLEIIKIILPAIIVFFTAYYSIRLLLNNESEKRKSETKSQTQKDILMLRLQAYERLILLLDRITPNNLIMRIGFAHKNVDNLHRTFLSEIRAEFDHNITQQLYISEESWKIVRQTKEEIIKIINVAKERLNDEADIRDFTKAIVEYDLKSNSPATQATNYLKKEAQTLF